MTQYNRATATIIARMLKENTGRALCDSGGEPTYDAQGNYTGSTQGYGRNHERNARRTFENEPESVVSFRHGEISVTHNVYHWLASRLTYNEARDKVFSAWCELPENADEHWLGLMDGYLAHLKAHADDPPCDDCGEDSIECGGINGGCDCGCHQFPEPHGIYGEGDPITVNTYNGEDLLAQTLQFVFWTEGERGSRTAWVLLQIHGGADVRGGYTRPRLFEVTGDDETCIFDNARATIGCSECDASWYTDDGCHWYESNREGDLDCDKLEAEDAVFADAQGVYDRLYSNAIAQRPLWPSATVEEDANATVRREAQAKLDTVGEDDDGARALWTIVLGLAGGERFLRHTEDGRGFCPVCLKGQLKSWFY